MTATITEWKKHPLIQLIAPEDETASLSYQSRPFSFGLTKAKLILKHIDEIKSFVETEGKRLEGDIFETQEMDVDATSIIEEEEEEENNAEI